MADQKPGGETNKEIITPNREIIPIAATIVDATSTTSVPLIKKRWFQVTVGMAALALVVGIIANALTIPNSAIDLWNRWKNRSKPPDSTTQRGIGWQPPVLEHAASGIGTLECGPLIPWGFTYGETVLGIESDIGTNRIPRFYIGPVPGFTNRVPIALSLRNNRIYVDASIPLNESDFMTIRGIDVIGMFGTQGGVLPFGWDFNYSPNAVEFVDETAVPMLQVVYLRPDRISVRGYFSEGQQYMMLGEKIAYVGKPPVNTKRGDLKPMFKYPSALYLGQLAR